MAEGPAQSKRHLISRAQQMTLLEVLITSAIVGAGVVVANFLVRYIDFNTKIISEKNDAISAYDATILNIGACQDKDNNGRLSNEELRSCDPDSVRLEDVPGTLRYNVYESLAANEDLELVARQRNAGSACYDENGDAINYTNLYNQASNDEEREKALQGMRACSSLRVIPDALPNNKNTEALMDSLGYLFLQSNIEPELSSPRDEVIESEISGVGVIPVSFRVSGSGVEIIRVLDNIERSIRTIDITSGVFQWTTGGVSMRANANAYYLDEGFSLESQTVLKASDRR